MSENERELTEEEKYERQQQHNAGVHHGGVQQLGDFDVEQQNKDREEAEEAAQGGDVYNANDPALPTLDKDNVPEDDEVDRPVDEIKEKQGDLPSNEDNQEK